MHDAATSSAKIKTRSCALILKDTRTPNSNTYVECPKSTNIRNFGMFIGYMVEDIFFPCRKMIFPKNAYFFIILSPILNFYNFFK